MWISTPKICNLAKTWDQKCVLLRFGPTLCYVVCVEKAVFGVFLFSWNFFVGPKLVFPCVWSHKKMAQNLIGGLLGHFCVNLSKICGTKIQLLSVLVPRFRNIA